MSNTNCTSGPPGKKGPDGKAQPTLFYASDAISQLVEANPIPIVFLGGISSFSVPTSGFYRVRTRCQFDVVETGGMPLTIVSTAMRVNGVTVKESIGSVSMNGEQEYPQGNTTLPCVAEFLANLLSTDVLTFIAGITSGPPYPPVYTSVASALPDDSYSFTVTLRMLSGQ